MKSQNSLLQKLHPLAIKRDELLSRYTTLRLGGPADMFVSVKTQKELIDCVLNARKLSIPVLMLGGGTNTLIAENGYRGLVVKNETNTIKFAGMKGAKTVTSVYLEVDSGVAINRLVRFCLDEALAGLETFLGQPGTVGGAIWINAHNLKWGTFFGDNIIQAKLLLKNGHIKNVTSGYFKFSYDKSRIQSTGDIVLSAVIKLTKGEKDLLWKTATEVLEYRKITQPQGIKSAGCVFRNISKSDAMRLATPDYTQSAGYLLDLAGFKGQHCGGAYFSKHHANFLINDGNARADDMLELISKAKDAVKKRFNVTLKEEICLVGQK